MSQSKSSRLMAPELVVTTGVAGGAAWAARQTHSSAPDPAQRRATEDRDSIEAPRGDTRGRACLSLMEQAAGQRPVGAMPQRVVAAASPRAVENPAAGRTPP